MTDIYSQGPEGLKKLGEVENFKQQEVSPAVEKTAKLHASAERQQADETSMVKYGDEAPVDLPAYGAQEA